MKLKKNGLARTVLASLNKKLLTDEKVMNAINKGLKMLGWNNI